MSDLINVCVDAMGGDNAPGELVKGAVMAVNESDKVKVFLIGQEAAVNTELKKYTYDASRVEVINAEEVIDPNEAPVLAIRKKKEA